ncbi:Fe(3+) dicitrate ABC transporter substrate-binding protein [uncultured Paenibacillus sp.]|uniref:ABC transporter substrate-binding protein n=1 Tax=uncultured Paenibacillus sp. TaxID=227322 RepID=UPI0028D4F459|nr:Fe(3+) dicitrate ABC transporter substrate-binding protein [uncultured Paenibacillus sp.]
MRLHKSLLLFFTFMLVLGTLAGCGTTAGKQTEANAGAQAGTRIIKHGLGETQIKGTPQRVVVLELGFIESLLAVGVKPIGVAEDNKPNLIDDEVRKAIEGYKSVGTRAQPSFEIIKTLKPDLIVADVDRHKNAYAELSKIAPTIAVKNLNATYQDTIDAALVIADAVGKKAEAEKFVAAHKAKVQQLRAKAPKDNPSVLLVAERDKVFNARTLQFFSPGLLEAIGLNYAFKNQTDEYSVKMTIEQLLQIDPDVLILMQTVDGKSSIPAWADNPLWKNLKAVKNNRVYEVDVTTWSLRRSVQGAEKIMDEAEKLIFKSK